MILNINQLKKDLIKIKKEKPMIYHLTNYVAMPECANITCAIGASPIMSLDYNEVKEVISEAKALVVNIGTLTQSLIPTILLALTWAEKTKVPVLFDPVGAGATRFRTEFALEIIKRKVEVIKGNQGEISSLLGKKGAVKGVDSKIKLGAKLVKRFSNQVKSIVVATGEKDYISDGRKIYVIENGTEMFQKITAAGCMLGSVVASFLAVQKKPLIAVIEGLACYNISGEISAEKCKGVGSFKQIFFDEIFNISPKKIIERIKIKEF